MKKAARACRGSYQGGKNGEGVYQRIINLMPPHKVFIEACAGSAAVTRMIKPAEKTFLIEADPVQAISLREQMKDRAVVINGSLYEHINDIVQPDTDSLIFIDPPYLKAVRSSNRNMYKVEWEMQDHIFLTKWLHCRKDRIIVTHPRNILYENALQGWNTVDYSYQSRGGLKWDCIWYNYKTPERLHDYSNIGCNRTERQQNDRKIQRWLRKLAALPAVERNALIEAINTEYR